MDERAIGLVLGSHIEPEKLSSAARTAEAGGFDEIWLAEDFFFTGGVSGASIVLGATDRIKVGLGVVSAVARHPALLAMEISTLSRAFPGRLIAGIGLGVVGWVRQMGILPSLPVSALRECVTSVRRLLRGEEISAQGRTFFFDRVTLTHPEALPTPIYMGVIGPQMLRVSGEIADGTVFSVEAGDAYNRWARERIEEGRRKGNRPDRHRLTSYKIYSVAHDGAAARDAIRRPLAFYWAAGGVGTALSEAAGITAKLRKLLERGPEGLAAGMPNNWIEDQTVSGTPEECAARIKLLYESGVDSVALFPTPFEEADRMIKLTVDEVLPRL